MKKFVIPKIEIDYFEDEDVIVTSVIDVDDGDGEVDEGNIDI